MCEEFDTDQLVEFCQRLGLAKDGYLDEKDLAIVCNYIGLQAPEEMTKELFEELDTDKDGRVCLDELSQMLRGMPKNPPSPEKLKKLSHPAPATLSSSSSPLPLMETASRTDFSTLTIGDKGVFSILDPQNSGFTQVGMVVDLWSQLGISQDDSIQILKDMGFPANSRSYSLNIQDLTKAIEEESESSKETIPLVIQTALITYKTEAQYLRTICESMECERDKLKSDIYEAHQRSAMLAQEIDEQNARLEKNSQMLLQRIEAKYTEQIHELQQKVLVEKDALQQALLFAETQLKSLQDDDAKLKSQISKLNMENSALETEVANLTLEIRRSYREKMKLEKEISRYAELENRMMEMERRTTESSITSKDKLQTAYGEIQLLRDQNDELSAQLDGMKETVKILKVSQEKRLYANKKRNRASSTTTADGCEQMEECSDSPVEKIGKFHQSTEINILTDDPEELDHTLSSSCSQPDSGNFPVPVSISLAACMGESSTDPLFPAKVDMHSVSRNILASKRLETEYKTLEMEMESVKDKIVSMISEKEQLVSENRCLKSELDLCQHDVNFKSVVEIEVKERVTKVNAFTQTIPEAITEEEMDIVSSTSNTDNGLIEQLQRRIAELENESASAKASYENETQELKSQCSDLESSLDLLREEYEKCEDYWHDKLKEAREIYEQDRVAMDEKFQDLAMKINEYEDSFLPTHLNDRLPPIEERASLERQVTDLEEECDGLRKELNSVRVEQDSVVSHYQRQWETKVVEECGRLEQQVGALSQKCKDYESRISLLADEERSTLEESGLMDMLKDRVRQLEFQLKNQEEKYKYQIQQLERASKDKDEQLRTMTPEIPSSSSPSPQPNYNNNNLWKNEAEYKEKSKSLLEMLQHSKVDSMSIWPQRYAMSTDKSSSLPFIPVQDQPYNYSPGGWGQISPNYQHELWNFPQPPTTQGKKAWCHVELGWLQGLRLKLKQRDEQCFGLHRALQQKDMETEKIFAEVRYKHEAEVSNWESLMHASQELVRQQAIKHKEQAEKLAHSDLLMKDLWVENSKLMAALSASEQRVIHLENLLKYQINSQSSHNSNQNPVPSSPHSLQYPPHHFSTYE